MLSYETALAQILSTEWPALAIENVSLADCLGRTLAVDQHAGLSLPPFANSAMDGYAVNTQDIVDGSSYRVSQRIAAGESPAALERGTVARIFTGAPMPDNADAVVIQENTVVNDGFVKILEPVEPCQHIRPVGDDVEQGAKVLSAGETFNPRSLAVMASLGEAHIPCFRRLKIALLATGNEIRGAGALLAPGEIYDSNYPMLAAELSGLNVDLIDFGVVSDNPVAIRKALQDAASKADIVISIGGMSVGGEDHVREQVNAIGSIDFWKVAIKPGKPLAFGRIGSSRFFGLPGNPVSSYVTFHLFVKPAIRQASGSCKHRNLESFAISDFNYANKGGRREFLRVALGPFDETSGLPMARLYRTQSSGVLSSLTYADALAIVPEHGRVSNGQHLKLMML